MPALGSYCGDHMSVNASMITTQIIRTTRIRKTLCRVSFIQWTRRTTMDRRWVMVENQARSDTTLRWKLEIWHCRIKVVTRIAMLVASCWSLRFRMSGSRIFIHFSFALIGCELSVWGSESGVLRAFSTLSLLGSGGGKLPW
jgi:hypothetical protein